MPETDLSAAELLSVLEWYRAAGVDLAVGEAPVDRFARPAPLAASSETVLSRPPPNIIAGAEESRALAARARTLDELRDLMDSYEGCQLKFRATQLVFADGNPEAQVMLVGEGPGGEEDRVGRPFVGRAGQLLDRMLAAIGLDRTGVFIVNTVPWRPPGNRNPTPAEIAQCLPFLHRQIELVAPRFVVALGAVAAQSLFGTAIGITRLRGQWRDLQVGSHRARALATLHPAYLLRVPSQKQQAWHDLLLLKQALAGEIAGQR